jgi:hypothetical protein
VAPEGAGSIPVGHPHLFRIDNPNERKGDVLHGGGRGILTPPEAGATTGELELGTSVTPDGGIGAMVGYAGGQDLYAVSGSPVRGVSERPDQGSTTLPTSTS